MTTRPSDADLIWIEAAIIETIEPIDRGNLKRLPQEIRRLRSLLERIYDHVNPTPGTDELQAELEREVMAIRAERKGPRT